MDLLELILGKELFLQQSSHKYFYTNCLALPQNEKKSLISLISVLITEEKTHV